MVENLHDCCSDCTAVQTVTAVVFSVKTSDMVRYVITILLQIFPVSTVTGNWTEKWRGTSPKLAITRSMIARNHHNQRVPNPKIQFVPIPSTIANPNPSHNPCNVQTGASLNQWNVPVITGYRIILFKENHSLFDETWTRAWCDVFLTCSVSAPRLFLLPANVPCSSNLLSISALLLSNSASALALLSSNSRSKSLSHSSESKSPTQRQTGSYYLIHFPWLFQT